MRPIEILDRLDILAGVIHRVLPLYFCGVTALLSATPWTCIRTPDFNLYSNSGERASRAVLERFERARQVIGPNTTLPIDILLFSSAADLGAFRRGARTAAFYQSGFDRDYIVLAAGTSIGDRGALHEYTHLVLKRNSAVLPLWFEEGLAEFYSNLIFERSSILLGSPIATHLALLRERSWLSATELRTPTATLRADRDDERTGMFYAQSWALVRMLNLDPQWRQGLETFVEELARNVPQGAAFHDAFHRSLDDAIADLRVSLERPQIPRRVDAASKSIVAGKAEPVSQAEVIALRADIHALLGQTAAADALARGLASKYPDTPQAYVALASIALRAHRLEEALGYYRKAIDRGTSDGRALFEYAMLLRDTGAPGKQATEWLRKAVSASPGLAEAHFLLGVRAADEGRLDESVECLRRATSIAPRQSYYWHALALTYHRMGDSMRSRDAAYRARNAAVTDQEIGQAEAALLLLEPEGPRPVPKETVITPPTWDNPRGDATVDGILTQFDCGTPARVHVAELVLEIRDPNRVVLEGVEGVSTTLACGAQKRPVTVEYKSSTHEVTRIRFKSN